MGHRQQEGGLFLQVLGTLGLVETILLICYSFGNTGIDFTPFEAAFFIALSLFEVLSLLSAVMALCYMCNNTSRADRWQNARTWSRDSLHNLLYPRSAPRSRKRRDFAGFAWYGVLIAVIPVIMLLTFYPMWTSSFDGPLYVRLVSSLMAVLAVVEIAAGCRRISVVRGGNHSSYGITVLYANSRAISLFLLISGGNRLVLGEGEEALGAVLGLTLAFLQVVKVVSACIGAGRYLQGMPDEDMPKLKNVFTEMLCSCE